MMKLYYQFLGAIRLCAVAVALLLAAGCGFFGKKPAGISEGPVTAQREADSEGFNHFVNANLLEIFGTPSQAAGEYEKALKAFPTSVTLRTDYARLLFRSQRPQDALRHALMVAPKSSEIYLLIGDCYRLQNSPEQAIGYYREAVALDSNNINAYWYLAGYYRQASKEDSAISAYYSLARLSETYLIWHELGALLGKNGRFREAVDAFKTSIDLNSDKSNMSAYLGLAAAYDALDSTAWAEQVLNQSAMLDSSDIRVYRQMLAFHMERQNITGAIAAAEKMVALAPSDWVAQRRLGILLYSDNRLVRADSLFRSRIEFGDDNILNYFYMGRIAVENQKYDEATDMFLEVTAKDPLFIDGWLNLGYAYRQRDSLDAAIGIFNQGLNHAVDKEDRIRLLFALGSAYERQSQFEKAVQAFQEIILIDSNHAPSLNYLGYMLADRGVQLQYALELLERAITLSPDNGAYIDSYAWVQFRLGKYDLALLELKKAAGLIQNDPTIFEHLGDVYRALGNEQEAVSNYRRSLEIDPQNKGIEEKLK